jgi:DNA polymerase-3 subunit epsilon
MRFNSINVAIHGIDEENVEDAPEFPEIWEEILPWIVGYPLVAHNASFDVAVLRGLHASYGLTILETPYLCSMVTARCVWPGLLSYGLSAICEYIGHQFEHHHAGEDAEAAARVLLAAAEATDVSDPFALLAILDVQPGQISPIESQRCRRNALRPSILRAESDKFDVAHPMFGSVVAFTGGLDSMPRREAMQMVVNLGGQCTRSVSARTNFLVLGHADYHLFSAGHRTGKLTKAEGIIAAGGELKIISEFDFLGMLSI